MSLARFLALLLAVALIGGCGRSGSGSGKSPPPADEVKAALKEIAASGQTGSQIITLRESLETLKASDPAKAEPLLKDLGELEHMAKPALVRAKAKAMMNKL